MKPIKVFVSQPMNGKSYDEVLETRKIVLDKVKKQLDGYPVDVLMNYWKNKFVYLKELSYEYIKLMEQADLVVFVSSWQLCEECAIEYYYFTNHFKNKRIVFFDSMDLSDYKEYLWEQDRTEEQIKNVEIENTSKIVRNYLTLLHSLGMMEQISNMHDVFREQLFHLAYMISHYKNTGMEQDSLDRCELEKEIVKEAMKTIRKFAQEKNLY